MKSGMASCLDNKTQIVMKLDLCFLIDVNVDLQNSSLYVISVCLTAVSVPNFCLLAIYVANLVCILTISLESLVCLLSP